MSNDAPDYGDGFTMGRASRDKEVEALQTELAAARRLIAELEEALSRADEDLERCDPN